MVTRNQQPLGAGLVPGKQHGVFVLGDARIQGLVALGRTATSQLRRCTESAVDEDANVLRPNRGPEEFVAALEDVDGFRIAPGGGFGVGLSSEEHTSELQSLMRLPYAVFCLKTQKTK